MSCLSVFTKLQKCWICAVVHTCSGSKSHLRHLEYHCELDACQHICKSRSTGQKFHLQVKRQGSCLHLITLHLPLMSCSHVKLTLAVVICHKNNQHVLHDQNEGDSPENDAHSAQDICLCGLFLCERGGEHVQRACAHISVHDPNCSIRQGKCTTPAALLHGT